MSERYLPDEALLAADDVIDALERFGIEGERIIDAVPEHDDTATTPRTAVASYASRIYAVEDGLTPAKRNGVLQDVLAWSDLGISTDHTSHHKRNLEFQIDERLHEFGYEFEFRSLGVDDWIEPESHHPRAFRFVVVDRADGTRLTAVFRYPPNESTRSASNQFGALAAALNDTVLGEIGLRMLHLDIEDDSYNWVLISRERLAELESEFGERLALLGVPLVRRCPEYPYSWKQIADSPTLDHEETFGVPEPDETYKAEEEYDLQNPTTQRLW